MRCAHCAGKLGLGVRFENYFMGIFGWAHRRFCSQRCLERYNERIVEERRVLPLRQWLFARPP